MIEITQKAKDIYQKYTKIVIFFLVILLFSTGYYFGVLSHEKTDIAKVGENHQVRQGGQYKFINPLIECELFSNSGLTQSVQLEKKASNLVKETLKNPQIKDISIYYRDLNNGPWFGYNENTKFTPASLLKVPIMIAYLKEAQDNPAILEKKYEYKNIVPTDPISQSPGQIQKLKFGNKYTTLEIIQSMIEYSDNNAVNVLIENRSPDYFNKINNDLMIPNPKTPDLEESFISVKEYASFFRILYNSSYLSRNMSERALEILSKSNFEEALVSGLPKNTTVAHKFGIRNNNGLIQIHDCGVIYNKDAPYLLCVMTRGYNLDLQKQTIGKISQTIWNGVQK